MAHSFSFHGDRPAPMRVLQVINSLIPAGAEMLLHDMVPRFREHGIDVSVAVLKSLDSPLEHDLRSSAFEFLPIESRIYSPAHVARLSRYLDRFDLVHSYLFPSQLWVALAARGKKVPLVTTEQNTTNRRRTPLLRPFDRWMYRQYRAIACCSPAARDALAAWAPEVRDRLSVIYNGVPIERFQKAAAAVRGEALPAARQRYLVAFVARFDPQKDHDTLVRALACVPDTDLLLAGDGPLRPVIECRAQELGVQHRVHFLGRRADIPQLLKMCDAYVHAAHWEGFGIAAVEAMAAGLPVIASDVPGLSGVVEGAGRLFPPGNAEALAATLQEVLASQRLRHEMADASRRRAPEFSIERSVQGWIDLYQNAVHPPATPGRPTATPPLAVSAPR